MRGLRRFGLYMGIIFLIGWVAITVEDLGPCGDNAVEEWFDESTAIMESFNFSLDRAKASYQNQQRIEAPECLLTLQEHSVNYYYYVWKALEAEKQENYTLATSYLDKANEAFEKLDIESSRFGAERGWNAWDVRLFEDEY